MPGLLLDDGTFQPMVVPSRTTIGRSPANDIQPDSQSISKNHGVIEIAMKRGRLVTTIEDLDSRNGTYTGPDTLEMERVKGKKEIQFGHFIRFGNGGKFFRYLEEAPKDAIVLEPEPVPSTARSSNRLGVVGSSSESPARGAPIGAVEVPGGARSLDPRLARSMPEFSNPAFATEAPPQSYTQNPWQPQQQPPQWHQQPPQWQQPQMMPPPPQPQQQPDDKNMTISIQYPTAGRQPLQPVTISIDPQQAQQQQTQRYGGAPTMSLPASRLIEDAPAAAMHPAGYAAPGDYAPREDGGRFTPQIRSSNDWDTGTRVGQGVLPPPLEDVWEPPTQPHSREGGSKGSSLPPLQPKVGYSREGKPTGQVHSSFNRENQPNGPRDSHDSQVRSAFPPQLPGSPVRGQGQGREPIVSAYHGNKVLPDKPLAKLVRRIWLPIEDLPMTTLTDALLLELHPQTVEDVRLGV